MGKWGFNFSFDSDGNQFSKYQIKSVTVAKDAVRRARLRKSVKTGNSLRRRPVCGLHLAWRDFRMRKPDHDPGEPTLADGPTFDGYRRSAPDPRAAFPAQLVRRPAARGDRADASKGQARHFVRSDADQGRLHFRAGNRQRLCRGPVPPGGQQHRRSLPGREGTGRSAAGKALRGSADLPAGGARHRAGCRVCLARGDGRRRRAAVDDRSSDQSADRAFVGGGITTGRALSLHSRHQGHRRGDRRFRRA